ncbi:tRNA dihydrouridine synthase DusB [Hyphomicrobium sp. 99]|uniref:tRNA dihydrouridine synthase DusB n=1 Tax=Hyphomicrobium sp. 99 TaxID=1163419 RepID=UPI0005F76C95|nr:tRNA dihydrouridine synthase DusB [Hyphomicrobium sp. 99]
MLENIVNGAPPAVLAPMSGVSDLPFRRLAHRLGASLVVSEMVASEELVKSRFDVLRRVEGRDITPFVVQLAGREERWMAEGARIAEAKGANIIDINMGCPAKEVTGKLSGSALMRNLDHAQALIKAVIGAVKVPVTLKMRLGWDNNTQNAPELAKRAEAEGIKLITVHGRTRCQFFTGTADWSAVRPVVEATSLPVLVNGDILVPEHAALALEASGARGVMIGRGAYGAPWMPGRIANFLSSGRDAGDPELNAQRDIALEHVEAMFGHYGRELGVRNARKHIGWYLASSGASEAVVKSWRAKLCTMLDPERVLDGLKTFYSCPESRAA